jgi:hypothetical protein
MHIRNTTRALAITAVLAALAVGAGFQTAHACSGYLCTDAERPVEVQALAVDSSTVRVSWVGHQATQYDTVDVSVRRDSPTGPETISQLPLHAGQGAYQGHYPRYVNVVNLSFNTTYCFAVRTHGDNQTLSDWSDYACATTPYPPFSSTTPSSHMPLSTIHDQGTEVLPSVGNMPLSTIHDTGTEVLPKVGDSPAQTVPTCRVCR